MNEFPEQTIKTLLDGLLSKNNADVRQFKSQEEADLFIESYSRLIEDYVAVFRELWPEKYERVVAGPFIGKEFE